MVTVEPGNSAASLQVRLDARPDLIRLRNDLAASILVTRNAAD
jgi:hypothetical protein